MRKALRLSDMADNFPTAEVAWEDLLGLSYRPEGRGADRTIDCIGVVLEVFRRAGLVLPDPKADGVGILGFQELFEPISAADHLYDLVLIRKTSYHVGLIVRYGKVLSAAEFRGVYTNRLVVFERVPEIQFWRIRSEVLP